MYLHMNHMDTAVLLSLGFTGGIAEGLYWGTANDGSRWHVQDDGLWLLFAKCRPSGLPGCYERMKHQDFDRLFRKPPR